ncbi:MAG: class I SAM-dependent methyltransferase [Rhodopirellula sp.]|nr:class I SAM-dependent methyltransferase [Rhodopirellula sp.]
MTTYFDQSAATWDNEPRRIALMKAVGEAILREAGPSSDMDVLDYGCGTGLVSLFLLPHVRSVTGADNSPGMLEVLQKKIAEGGVGNMKVMHMNLEEGTVPNDRYHLIVTSMTMHHVADTAKVIRGFHELLHPGRRLCIADLDKEPGVFHPPEANSSVHHHGFDREWLKNQLMVAGFTDMHDVTAHTVTKPIATGEERDFPVFLIVGRRR